VESERPFPEAIRLEIVDRRIARLAERQHGVVATRQLAALGLQQRAVSYRAAAGRLHRVHRGVYAVGHTVLTANGRRMAAVLAAGPGAVLSHASAAALWEIRPTNATRIDVTVRTKRGRARRGLRIHRTSTLQADEVTDHQGIPVTTPSRTLLDLAATLPRRALERALDEAEVQELYDLTSLTAIARAHAGERGARALTEALDHDPGTTLTDSELEELMLALCDEHRLERPKPQTRVAGLRVDFYFAAARLVVETDGYRYHRTRRAFERDRERDAILARAGYRTLRFTHRQLTKRAAEVAATITKVGDSVGNE
jgi:very-short-patch-repair endonuclease/predicted transcriptional regulator of viral defense system